MKHYSRFDWLKTRIGFVLLLVALTWAKTQMANILDFKLFADATPVQYMTLLLNPIPFALLLIGISLYFKSAKLFYPIALLMYISNLVLLQVNMIYYREFSDFMSFNVMMGYDKVNQGLGASGFALSNTHDIFLWLDLIILLGLVIFRKYRFNAPAVSKLASFAVTTFAIFIGMITLMLGEAERPQLITRQFDSKLMVKYLGVDGYTIFDIARVRNVSELKKTAKKSDIDKIREYMESQYAPANTKYAGVAEGKNVFVIHLESFQQFSLNLDVNGQAVTPFLNSIYNSKDTIAFDNFFNQVGQGKTSDAENLLETSTFGLPQGSLFANQGSDQTFQAMPAILRQEGDYSSAVFHGNTAGFWNRNNVYKNMGYQYFFDASYFDTTGDKAAGYGLKDKLLFYDSVPYLERMQQPFYSKFITVTNHFPYTSDDEDKDKTFQTTNSGSKIVDGYFETNRYLDQSIAEFYAYLKKSGLYENSIVVMYGDHYGISNSESKHLAELLGKDPAKWSAYDAMQLQRVPFIINMPGYGKGYIDHTLGGEVDVAPTLLHLLGIKDTEKYMQMGHDLLSKKKFGVVAMRDGSFITPKYTYINERTYVTATGEEIVNPTPSIKAEIDAAQEKARKQLSVSDEINQKDLLRFYTPEGFEPVKAQDYNYSNGLAKLKRLEKEKGKDSKSLFSEKKNTFTQKLYETDAPQKDEPRSDTTRLKQTNPDAGESSEPGFDMPNP